MGPTAGGSTTPCSLSLLSEGEFHPPPPPPTRPVALARLAPLSLWLWEALPGLVSHKDKMATIAFAVLTFGLSLGPRVALPRRIGHRGDMAAVALAMPTPAKQGPGRLCWAEQAVRAMWLLLVWHFLP